jgi:transcriptional regulatory protein LevR
MERFAINAPKNIGKILQPEQVASFIYNVSQKPNPKAVYKINNGLQLKVAAFIPFSQIERLVRKRLTG